MNEYIGPFALVPATVLQLDITHNELKVLLGLLSFRNKNTGLCNPGREKLSQRINLSEQATSRAVGGLRKKGFLKYKKKGFTGRHKYTLNLPESSIVSETHTNETPNSVRNPRPIVSETHTNECVDNPHEQITDNRTNNITKGVFDAFWTQYPKKKARGSAEKAFKKLHEDDYSALFAGLDRACKHWRNIEPRFIPHPATWLNAQGWLDEYENELQQTSHADNQSTSYKPIKTTKPDKASVEKELHKLRVSLSR